MQNKLYYDNGEIVITDEDGIDLGQSCDDILTEKEYRAMYSFESVNLESKGNKKLEKKTADKFYRIFEAKRYDSD